VYNYRRAHRTRAAQEASRDTFDQDSSAKEHSPLDLALRSHELQVVRRLLGTLDGKKREVFMLAALEEMSVPEIADAIGVPLNTAYSRLREARRDLSRALSREAAADRPWSAVCES
jgi:RNA polymerase sigma-70 factor (ECF subfamily)